MSIVLLVRNAADVLSAIKGANHFLVSRWRKCAAPRQDDEVLGIWLRHELDDGLLVSYLADQPEARDSFTDESESSPALSVAPVGMRCSSSHSGLWSLCWMDGSQIHEARNASERRQRIVDTLLSPAHGSRFWSREGVFFPVFGAAESIGSVDAAMQELRRDYPQLISSIWFIDDSERGILTPCLIEA